MKDDDDWIEKLFAYAEANIDGYTRPADWRERTKRILASKRKPYAVSNRGRNWTSSEYNFN